MRPESSASSTSVRIFGKPIPGAEDRQRLIPGFDQTAFSKASVCCVGAGGIISHVVPTLVRKGIGKITLLDRDIVEVSNLNRQFFYEKDIGQNKAIALAGNLQRECIAATEIRGHALMLDDAIVEEVDLSCDLAICGVDNNPARVAASRYFRLSGIPVVFAAVSREGDHGYVFVQGKHGACIGCLLPDLTDDNRYPCPGTPAIADILEVVGAFAAYAVDTLILTRVRRWNYRHVSLVDGALDRSAEISSRSGCMHCSATR